MLTSPANRMKEHFCKYLLLLQKSGNGKSLHKEVFTQLSCNNEPFSPFERRLNYTPLSNSCIGLTTRAPPVACGRLLAYTSDYCCSFHFALLKTPNHLALLWLEGRRVSRWPSAAFWQDFFVPRRPLSPHSKRRSMWVFEHLDNPPATSKALLVASGPCH